MGMLMLNYIKCMLSGIKSWHDRNISMCRTMRISNVSDKQRKLMENQARQDRPRIQKKIKEMPVRCLKGNSGETRLPENPSDATRGLEKKCQLGIHKSSGVIDRLRTRGTPRRGLENKTECPG